MTGHFSAEAWVDASKAYLSSSELGVYITVDEVFDNMHRIVSQTGASKGRFTFSAADSGEHRLCFQPTGAAAAAAAGGWLSGAHPAGHGGIKFTLDMAIGETSAIEGNDRGKIEDMVLKVKDLNARLQDVRREQVYQRVSTTAGTAGAVVLVLVVLTRSPSPVGTGGRVQRPVRVDECARRALVPRPARHPRRHLRLATLPSSIFLHQAEADLTRDRLGERFAPAYGSIGHLDTGLALLNRLLALSCSPSATLNLICLSLSSYFHIE